MSLKTDIFLTFTYVVAFTCSFKHHPPSSSALKGLHTFSAKTVSDFCLVFFFLMVTFVPLCVYCIKIESVDDKFDSEGRPSRYHLSVWL